MQINNLLIEIEIWLNCVIFTQILRYGKLKMFLYHTLAKQMGIFYDKHDPEEHITILFISFIKKQYTVYIHCLEGKHF